MRYTNSINCTVYAKKNSSGKPLPKGKGERRQIAKGDGTNNPFKKLKTDPNKPGSV